MEEILHITEDRAKGNRRDIARITAIRETEEDTLVMLKLIIQEEKNQIHAILYTDKKNIKMLRNFRREYLYLLDKSAVMIVDFKIYDTTGGSFNKITKIDMTTYYKIRDRILKYIKHRDDFDVYFDITSTPTETEKMTFFNDTVMYLHGHGGFSDDTLAFYTRTILERINLKIKLEEKNFLINVMKRKYIGDSRLEKEWDKIGVKSEDLDIKQDVEWGQKMGWN